MAANDEEEIRKLISTWMDATKRGDTATVLGLITDDVVFLRPGSPPMRKAEFEATLKAQAPAGGAGPTFEGESEIQEIKIMGDWAFIWTKLKVTAKPPGGRPSVRAGHTLTLLQKQNGAWRLARDANLLAPVTPNSS